MDKVKTKQEEIREGIAKFICGGLDPLKRAVPSELSYRKSDNILTYLKSQGCVLKVVKELPDNKAARKQLESELFKGETNWYYKGQLDMLEAGYTAYEELI
jgi:hypothetical protein